MHYTEDRSEMAEWMPLMMPGRPLDEKIAATRVMNGTDVNFGALTNQLLSHLTSSPDAQVKYCKRVTGLKRNGDGWTVSIKDVNSGRQSRPNRSKPPGHPASGLAAWRRNVA